MTTSEQRLAQIRNGETEKGICDLCGQDMVLTEDDCWHPYYVKTACPPEHPISDTYPRGIAFGDGYGRPGREHFKRVTC